MKKRKLAMTCALLLGVSFLTACGSNTPPAPPSEPAAETQEAAIESAQTPDPQETQSTEDKGEDSTEQKGTVKVAATSVPHAEILEAAKPLMQEKGWTLEVVEFTDYVQPNEVVEGGDMDANYFQHINYLNSYNEEKGTHLVNAGEIHYEPLGIYPGKETDLNNIPEGAEIAVPNDTTNEARALLLLQENGLIKLDPAAGIKATVMDIQENPRKLKIVELNAEQVPRTLPDVAFGVINGNYALQAGLSTSDAVALETADSEAIKQYVNVLAVKEGNENSEGIKALAEVLKSGDIRSFINEKYQGSVVPYEG